jgi:hypothetical protein
MQEAEIGMIAVLGQPWQKTFTRFFLKRNTVYSGTCLSSQLWQEASTRRIVVQAGQDRKQDPISKITRAKRAGGVDQAVEHLPRKKP